MGILVLLIAYLIYKEMENSRKINAFWKEWEENSFLFGDGRYNKDVFEIRDGKVVFKEGKQ